MNPPHKKFPTFAVVMYLVAHIVVGLFVSLASLGEYQLIRELFAPVDAVLPTFRTWFEQSKDPVGCRVMLLLWWVVFVPWGLISVHRFTGGYTTIDKKALSKIKWFAVGFFFTALISYVHSFMNHTATLESLSMKAGRTSLMPLIIHHGPFYFSAYLAAMSLLFVMMLSMVLVILVDSLSPN
jgi:hypothetical protein